jgi:hypothetical protein
LTIKHLSILNEPNKGDFGKTKILFSIETSMNYTTDISLPCPKDKFTRRIRVICSGINGIIVLIFSIGNDDIPLRRTPLAIECIYRSLISSGISPEDTLSMTFVIMEHHAFTPEFHPFLE